MRPRIDQTIVDTPAATTRSEVLVFLLLAVLVWPLLTVGVVGGYGFAVWMRQQVFGPPHMEAPHGH